MTISIDRRKGTATVKSSMKFTRQKAADLVQDHLNANFETYADGESPTETMFTTSCENDPTIVEDSVSLSYQTEVRFWLTAV